MITNILNNKKTPIEEVFEKIYKYTLINQPPRDFRIPYIIPIKKANLEELKSTLSLEEITKVKLDHGTLTDVKAKNAIKSIQENWDPALVEKTHKAISSSLSHVLPISNEIS